MVSHSILTGQYENLTLKYGATILQSYLKIKNTVIVLLFLTIELYVKLKGIFVLLNPQRFLILWSSSGRRMFNKGSQYFYC